MNNNSSMNNNYVPLGVLDTELILYVHMGIIRNSLCPSSLLCVFSEIICRNPINSKLFICLWVVADFTKVAILLRFLENPYIKTVT